MDTVAVVGSLCDRPLLCVGYSKLVSIDKTVVCWYFANADALVRSESSGTAHFECFFNVGDVIYSFSTRVRC